MTLVPESSNGAKRRGKLSEVQSSLQFTNLISWVLQTKYQSSEAPRLQKWTCSAIVMEHWIWNHLIGAELRVPVRNRCRVRNFQKIYVFFDNFSFPSNSNHRLVKRGWGSVFWTKIILNLLWFRSICCIDNYFHSIQSQLIEDRVVQFKTLFGDNIT